MLLPLLVAAARGGRGADRRWVDELATAGLAWSLPFLLGLLAVGGLTLGGSRLLGLAPGGSATLGVAGAAAVVAGGLVTVGTAVLADRLAPLVRSTSSA